ncbi:MAG: hypothetical protein SGJ18_12675 [Pseudomonadota bacterium]|nr:hypothetical protein [Pseudomonadota bacterium]
MSRVLLIVSLVISVCCSSLSFARNIPTMKMSPQDNPCGGDTCVQKCIYAADAVLEYQGIEVEGDVDITTVFDNSSYNDRAFLRTLISVKTRGFNAKALYDESSVFDTKTWKLDKTYTFMKLAMGNGDRGLKKVEWSETAFDWGSPSSTKVTAIAAKSVDELKNTFPGFYKFLSDDQFGKNWMSEFAENNPEHKPNRDMKDFSENILSPTFVSLFHLRFIPLNDIFKYELFVSGSSKLGPVSTTLNGEKTNKDGLVLFQGELAFGDFESQPGKPAKFYVDQNGKQFEKLEISMQNIKQGLKASAQTKSVTCQTISL